MTLLLTVLAATMFSLRVSSEASPLADFNVQEMAGKWYLIAFASNGQWFLRRRSNMKMGSAILTPTADGDLHMAYTSLYPDGSCWSMNNLAKKTDVSGKFTYESESWGNHNDMQIVDVKYDEYALIHNIMDYNGKPTVINKLYGRGVDLSPDLLERFRLFSLDTGVLPENIAFLPKNGECPAA